MCVGVSEGEVSMPMAMSLSRLDGFVVQVIVMFIVSVSMLVRKWRMLMDVLMAFAQMQPNTQSHQGSRGAELKRDGFAK